MIGFALAGFLIGICLAGILCGCLAAGQYRKGEIDGYEQGRRDGFRVGSGMLD